MSWNVTHCQSQVQTAQFSSTLIAHILNQDAHGCKLRTVTSWGHASVLHSCCCSLKKKGGDLEGEKEWEEWKTGDRGEGQGATSIRVCVQQDSQMDCNETLEWRNLEKKAGIFPGRLAMHVHAHSNSANTHSSHFNPYVSISTLLVLPTLSPSNPVFPLLTFLSVLSNVFLLAFPPHSFHFHPHCCLLHSPLSLWLATSVSLPQLPFSLQLGPSLELPSPDRHQGQGNILRWRLAITHTDMTALVCKNVWGWYTYRYTKDRCNTYYSTCMCVCVWLHVEENPWNILGVHFESSWQLLMACLLM